MRIIHLRVLLVLSYCLIFCLFVSVLPLYVAVSPAYVLCQERTVSHRPALVQTKSHSAIVCGFFHVTTRLIVVSETIRSEKSHVLGYLVSFRKFASPAVGCLLSSTLCSITYPKCAAVKYVHKCLNRTDSDDGTSSI